MRTKIIAALVAGGLLVGAGFVTSIVSAPGTAEAQEETTTTDVAKGLFPRALEFLGGVLDDLVGDGTISQEDATAVLDAVETKAEEARAEREALHELIKGLLDDGVLTADEATQLPEDHWFFSEAFDEAWADDQLTTEEIRENAPHPRRDAFKKGARFGALLDDGGIDQAELDGLGEDHPLNQMDLSEYLSDGVITIDELREIRQNNHPAGPEA